MSVDESANMNMDAAPGSGADVSNGPAFDGNAFRERDVRVNGIRLHVVESVHRGGPPVLLLHGLYNRAEAWLPVLPRLARSHHLIVPDLRGHCRSDWPDGGYALSDYAADAAGLLDALGIARAIVVGHSLGALAGLVLAALRPERVRALVMEDPPTERSEMIELWLSSLLEAKRSSRDATYALLEFVYPDRSAEERQRQTAWLHATADGPFEALLAGANLGADDFFATLARLHCPVLVLQANPDLGGAVSAAAAARLEQALLERVGMLRRFPENGHAIHAERPDAFVDAVEEFLAEYASPMGNSGLSASQLTPHLDQGHTNVPLEGA